MLCVLLNYYKKYGYIRFFSYGSNLNEADFIKRMKLMASEVDRVLNDDEAGLLNKKKCILAEGKRSLKNDSFTHGAAYTVHRNKNRIVEGVCHDITINALLPFLKKEALLPTKVKKYQIKERKVIGEEQPILILLGKKSTALNKLSDEYMQKALKYLETCISGAKQNDINPEDFMATKRYLLMLMKNKGLNVPIAHITIKNEEVLP